MPTIIHWAAVAEESISHRFQLRELQHVEILLRQLSFEHHRDSLVKCELQKPLKSEIQGSPFTKFVLQSTSQSTFTVRFTSITASASTGVEVVATDDPPQLGTS